MGEREPHPESVMGCSVAIKGKVWGGEDPLLPLEETSRLHHQLLLHVRQQGFLVPTWSSQDRHGTV